MIATVSSYGFQRPANPTQNLPAPQQHQPANGGSGGYHSIQPWTPPATSGQAPSGSQGGRQPTYQQPTIVPASTPYFQTQQHVAAPSISISQGSRTTSAGTSSYSVQQQFGPSGASQQAKRPYPDSSKQLQQSASSPQAYAPVSPARPVGPARPSQPSPSPLGNPVPHQWAPSFGPNVPAQNPSGASAGYQQPSNNVGHGVRAPPAQSRPAASPANGYPKPSAAGSNVHPQAASQTGKPANYQSPKQPTHQQSVAQPQTHSPTPSAGSYQLPKPSPVVSSIPQTNTQSNTPHATSYQIPKPSAGLGAPHSGPSTTSTTHSYQSPKPLSAPAGPPQSQPKYVAPPANQIPKAPSSAPHHTQKKPEAPLPVSQIPKPSASQSSAPSTSYLAPKIPAGSNLQQSWSSEGSQATQPSAIEGSYSQSAGPASAPPSVQEGSSAQVKQQPAVDTSSSYQQPALSPSSVGGFTESVGVLYQAPLPLAPAENVGVLYQAPLPLASAEKPSWQQNFPQLPIEEPVKIPEAVPSKSPSSLIEDSVLAPTFEQPSDPSFFIDQPSVEPAGLDQDTIRYAILDQHASPETFSTDAPESQQLSSYGSSAEHGHSQPFTASENFPSQQWGSTEQGSSQSGSYGTFQQADAEPSGPFQGSFDGSFHSFPETVTPPATSLQPPAYESADQYHHHHHQQSGSGASQSNGFHSSQPSLSVGAVGISQLAKQQPIGGASPSKEIVAAGTPNHNNQIANNQQRASPSANFGGQQSASNGKPPVAILSSESVLNVDGSFSYKYNFSFSSFDFHQTGPIFISVLFWLVTRLRTAPKLMSADSTNRLDPILKMSAAYRRATTPTSILKAPKFQ